MKIEREGEEEGEGEGRGDGEGVEEGDGEAEGEGEGVGERERQGPRSCTPTAATRVRNDARQVDCEGKKLASIVMHSSELGTLGQSGPDSGPGLQVNVMRASKFFHPGSTAVKYTSVICYTSRHFKTGFDSTLRADVIRGRCTFRVSRG